MNIFKHHGEFGSFPKRVARCWEHEGCDPELLVKKAKNLIAARPLCVR